MLLDHPRIADAGAGASPRESMGSLLDRCAAYDLNELSVPELDEMLSVTDRGESWLQGMRIRARAQRAKLVEAGRPNPSPDGPKPAKPLPKPDRRRSKSATPPRRGRWGGVGAVVR